MEQAGRFPRWHVPEAVGILGIRIRNRRQQRLCVWVSWRPQQIGHRGPFDNQPPVHHADPLAEVPDGRQVMRDVDHAQAVAVLEPSQQLQNLHPDGRVEHGHGLIGDDELGLEDHRPRDDEPLLLSSAEHVGKTRQKVVDRRQLHVF